MELILDASSISTRAAIARAGMLEWTSPLLAPQEHTRELLSVVMAGLDATSAAYADLRLVVVALGPGPFNGLRVAVSSAKGLAAGTGASIVGIPTLLAEACRCSATIGTVRPVIAAGRSAFATALYTWTEPIWSQTEETQLVDADGLLLLLDHAVPVCTEADADFHAAFPGADLSSMHFAAAHCSRLEALATLGWQRYVAADVIPAATLQPIYARPPHITIPRDRRP